MSLAEHVVDTGVVYIGGGVPKDWIQLISVTADLLYESREVPNRKDGKNRDNTGEQESYYPHKYAVQITTDSPQWGGLSGCTFEEAVSWGKEDPHGELVQCYCDASIALPIVSHALVERLKDFKLCVIDKVFNDVWTQDIIYFYVCVVLLSVLFSYVSIFQTNVALHKIL